jgi:carbamoyltransferase
MKCVENISYSDVASKLLDSKIVAIFQGQSEGGPRALGNRSILFDPRVHNGKDIVNSVKKREAFRPFAGSVLHQYSHEWFDMMGVDESPFMTYAFKCYPEKRSQVPSIVHVDGTCRIQTVKKEQNPVYYSLINEFYKQSGVPILLNTSFNLAGEAIVEDPKDAMHTFKNSNIDFLYFPEISCLLEKDR